MADSVNNAAASAAAQGAQAQANVTGANAANRKEAAKTFPEGEGAEGFSTFESLPDDVKEQMLKNIAMVTINQMQKAEARRKARAARERAM
ncbi:hypothetical protein BN1013_01443 [Candidatus Rubidus massiliensis]|nr:MAG: hypothetical protein BGO10_04605 [Chlamydia sp. 32-24]CDZ80916.1 hypothetical protein BN1013_01443 [Candidatus Rubidus massiliensis]